MNLTANHDPEEEESRKLQMWLKAQFMALPNDAAIRARHDCEVSKDDWRKAFISGEIILSKQALERLQLFVRQWKAGAYTTGADPFMNMVDSLMHRLPGESKPPLADDGGAELAFKMQPAEPGGPRPRLYRPTHPETAPEPRESPISHRVVRDDAGFQALRALIPEKKPYGFNSEVAAVSGVDTLYVAWLVMDHYFGPGADDKWTKLREAIIKVKTDHEAEREAFETLRKLMPENLWRGFYTAVANAAGTTDVTLAKMRAGKFVSNQDGLYGRIEQAIKKVTEEHNALPPPPPPPAPVAPPPQRFAPNLPDPRAVQVADLVRTVENFNEELAAMQEAVKRAQMSFRTISLQLRQLQRSFPQV